MSRTLDLFLGDTPTQLGFLRFDAQGQRQSASFEYHADWLALADRFAIEPALPLVTGPQFHSGGGRNHRSLFHGAIADTEPDGWGRRVILRDHAKQRRSGSATNPARPLNHLDFLLAVDDQSRIGALRFRDEEGIFRREAEPGRRTAPPLVELSALIGASRAVEANSETERDLAYLRGRGTSLGGLRPKCTVVDDDGALSIGKFPSIEDGRAVTHGEVLALRLARDAGIDAATARIVMSDDVPVTLVRRFDRTASGKRLLYVSAATMLGADPADEHTYTEIADALRQHGARPRADIEELWRRIVFSVLITNVDDHLHNHGLLHEGNGQWRLSPAFDINPFPERAREFKTWISEEAGPEARFDAAVAAAPYFGVRAGRAAEIVAQALAATARWRDVGAEIGMRAQDLDAFANAFEHDERAAAEQWSRRQPEHAS